MTKNTVDKFIERFRSNLFGDINQDASTTES